MGNQTSSDHEAIRHSFEGKKRSLSRKRKLSNKNKENKIFTTRRQSNISAKGVDKEDTGFLRCITFDDFIWAMSRLCRPKDDELNHALFQIYNISCTKTICIEDLFSILRTYENQGIIDKLEQRIKGKSENKIVCKSKSNAAPELDKLLNKGWDEIHEYNNKNLLIGIKNEFRKESETCFYQNAYIENTRIAKLAENTLIACGYSHENHLCISQFSYYMQQFPELVDLIVNSMRQEIWSETFSYPFIEKPIKLKENEECKTSPTTKFSHLSIAHPPNKLNDIIDNDDIMVTKSPLIFKYSNFISSENEVGTIEFFTQKVPCTMQGFLFKRKKLNYIQRFYYLKNGYLYYYGVHKKYIKRTPLGLIYIKNKILTKVKKDDMNLIRIINVSDGSCRIELAAPTEEEFNDWFFELQKVNCHLNAVLVFSGIENPSHFFAQISKNMISESIDKMKDQLIFEETIGTGQFSSVRKAHSIDGTKEYAVKIISKSDPSNYDREYIIRELRILSLINHPNIPKIYGFFEDEDRVQIFMENIKGGDLFDFVKKKEIVGEKEAAFIVYEILKTLKYIQELRIIHRDIKPENILIKTDQNDKVTNVYLIDFGLSTFFTTKNNEMQACGTLGYVAPEVLTKEGYGEASDIYSTGVVLFLLVTGFLPFDDKSDTKLMEMTVNSPLRLSPKIFKDLDKNLPDLLRGMMHKSFKSRLKVDDCLNHPFFKTFLNDK